MTTNMTATRAKDMICGLCRRNREIRRTGRSIGRFPFYPGIRVAAQRSIWYTFLNAA